MSEEENNQGGGQSMLDRAKAAVGLGGDDNSQPDPAPAADQQPPADDSAPEAPAKEEEGSEESEVKEGKEVAVDMSACRVYKLPLQLERKVGLLGDTWKEGEDYVAEKKEDCIELEIKSANMARNLGVMSMVRSGEAKMGMPSHVKPKEEKASEEVSEEAASDEGGGEEGDE